MPNKAYITHRKWVAAHKEQHEGQLRRWRTRNPENGIFWNMVSRCTRRTHPHFKNYGGRGIKVVYADFHALVADIGPRPSPVHTVDRINNDGNYEPGNCRWATRKEQYANRRAA